MWTCQNCSYTCRVGLFEIPAKTPFSVSVYLYTLPSTSTEEEEMSDPLKPSVSILSKLGSLAVHCEEMLSAKGHVFDRHAIAGILLDGELKEWLVQMDKMALLPVKR